jgi:hypothetical protein
MQQFPLDKIISDLKSQGRDVKKFKEFFLELKDSIYFLATLKRIEKELTEYQKLILKILKPSIDIQTKNAKSKYSFKPSKLLINKTTNSPVKLSGFRDFHRQQFIELSYIGLYHKIENAEKNLLGHLNKGLKTNYLDLSELNFDSRDKIIFNSRDRLRVVANCFKHNMGKANQQVCNHYPKMIINQTIRLNFVDFKKDITEIRKYYKQLSVFLVLFNQRKIFDGLLTHDVFNDTDDLKASIRDLNQEADKLLEILSTQNIFKKSGS